MLQLNREGCNRLVVLTARLAIKVPSPRCWRDFLFGLLNNMHERHAERDHPAHCPILWAAPLGLAIVMPRARILTDAEFAAADVPEGTIAEAKASSWGWLGERLVAVDYGWPTFGWPSSVVVPPPAAHPASPRSP